MTAMMTDRRHSRAPLRRSSAPEKILAAGLATATCVGLVGVIGARTVAADSASGGESSSTTTPQPAPDTALVEPTTSTGLTEADLDAYAAQLAAEREKLDAYRATLVKAGKKLQRQAAGLTAACLRRLGRVDVEHAARVRRRSLRRRPPPPQWPRRPSPSRSRSRSRRPSPLPSPAAAPASKPQASTQSNTQGS
jgi:hypothetical protein